MRDFHPDDDIAFPKGYVPESTPDDYDPGIPKQLLDFIDNKIHNLQSGKNF